MATEVLPFELKITVDGLDMTITGSYSNEVDANMRWHLIEKVMVHREWGDSQYVFWAIPDRGVPPESVMQFESTIHRRVMESLHPEQRNGKPV